MPTTTFAGLTFERPRIMGIVNVTPDSFSDGGETVTEDAAVARGLAMLADGADILDVGGESTRPGAAAVSQDEELNRVLPVVERLVGEGAVVSIDTRHGAVIAAAVAAGAAIINDVTALEGDPESLAIAAESGAHVILMHMRGEPATMQNAPSYRDVVAQVRDYLAARVEACEAAGIGKGRIAVDPGIGFGKTVEHNLALIANLNRFGDLGCPLVLGASRKSFIGALSGGAGPKDRLAGSLAAALAGAERGASILRVHDVAETRQALAVWGAVLDANVKK